MEQYFEVKARYQKIMKNGAEKRVKETYLFNALSFTEAERKSTKELLKFVSGEFEICAIKKANYNEIFFCDEIESDKYFKCKLNIIMIDEKTGKEKKTPIHILVQASNVKDAENKLNEGMKGTMADYEVSAVSDTNIIDVYKE